MRLLRAVVAIALLLNVAGPAAATIAEGAVGASQQKSAGALAQNSYGAFGELRTQEAQARYADLVLSGKMFTASNIAVQALSVNSPTATGLVLTNPCGSGVNLVLTELLIGVASLPAGQASFVLTGSTAVAQGSMAVIHTTPLVIQNALWGGPRNSAALADSAATIPGNVIARTIPGGPAATVASSTSWPPLLKDPIDGVLVMQQCSVLSLQSITTAISVMATVTWYERPAGTMAAQ